MKAERLVTGAEFDFSAPIERTVEFMGADPDGVVAEMIPLLSPALQDYARRFISEGGNKAACRSLGIQAGTGRNNLKEILRRVIKKSVSPEWRDYAVAQAEYHRRPCICRLFKIRECARTDEQKVGNLVYTYHYLLQLSPLKILRDAVIQHADDTTNPILDIPHVMRVLATDIIFKASALGTYRLLASTPPLHSKEDDAELADRLKGRIASLVAIWETSWEPEAYKQCLADIVVPDSALTQVMNWCSQATMGCANKCNNLHLFMTDEIYEMFLKTPRLILSQGA